MMDAAHINEKKTLRFPIFEFAFSAIFGIIYSLGANLNNAGIISVSITQIIVAGLGCFILLFAVGELMDWVGKRQYVSTKRYGLKMWLGAWIAGMIVDFICLLTYFPGVGMNDGLNILRSGMSTANQFPVFYVAFVTVLAKIGKRLGSLQISIAMYSVLQVLAVSAACAFIITWFFNKCAPKLVKYIVLIYLVAEPLLTMYAISMLKDTLFSVLVIVLMLICYDLLIEKEANFPKWEWVVFAISVVGVLCVRNNGTYIVFPLMIILIIACSRHRRGIFNMILLSLVVVVLSNLAMSHFNREQMFQEMIGIPLQQIAAVVANDGNMTEEQKDFISQIMPLDEMAEKYRPSSVDYIKWGGGGYNRSFLESHPREFLLTWAQMLPHNLGIYIKAYLQQTFWFWAPYQKGTVQCYYTIETMGDNAWLPEFMEENGIHDQPLLPESLNQLLREWFSLGKRFLREGVCFWIALATLALLLIKKKKLAYIGVYAPVLLCWLTIMVSTPIAYSMRYVLALAYGLPIFAGLLFVKAPVQNNDNMEEMQEEL